MTKKTNVVFFFPDEKIGGGPFYLIRLAVKLSEDEKYKVFYMDYKNGYSHKIEANTSRITFIDYKDYCSDIQFSEPCILFTPIYYLHNMPIIHKASKILFFNWHNLCLPVLQKNIGFSNSELHSFLSIVQQRNAEVFCDAAHREAHNSFGKVNFPDYYVPISAEIKEGKALTTLVSQDEINIAVLGRLVTDKIFSLNNVIENAEKLHSDKIINIHIIGDGDCKEEIKQIETNRVRLKMLGYMTGNELNDYLTTQVDILFAMGTSVLEGAALGLPSVVCPNDVAPITGNEFVWLFDVKDYCLGWEPHQVSFCANKICTFEQIISDIYEKHQKQQIGEQCRNFLKDKFNIEKNCGLLKKYLAKTCLSFNELQRIVRKTSQKSVFYIFGFIPVLAKIRNADIKKYNLFGFIPIFKIKENQKGKKYYFLNILFLKEKNVL